MAYSSEGNRSAGDSKDTFWSSLKRLKEIIW